MRIIAWNIRAGGGIRVAAIGRQLQRWVPDVVALSEFRATPPSGLLRRALAECGLVHQLTTADPRAPTVNAGGIWAPSGPAVDEHGDVYVTTGNSFSGGVFDHGDSVIKLSPDLEELEGGIAHLDQLPIPRPPAFAAPMEVEGFR